ncbi:MAG TPA: acetone carboxylase subunit gamma [Baekduia sp.]|nr:acetone carboxylase subunit gamma [Baekduia sp.]
MRVIVTEYLRIDLDAEMWECRRCEHVHGSAREDYKRFLRVRARDPREIHKPLLDPERYAYTFAPDPASCAILEFYCPSCATLVEAEYTVPGHPPLHDLELDIDALRRQWADRAELTEPVAGTLAPATTGGCGHAH